MGRDKPERRTVPQHQYLAKQDLIMNIIFHKVVCLIIGYS